MWDKITEYLPVHAVNQVVLQTNLVDAFSWYPLISTHHYQVPHTTILGHPNANSLVSRGGDPQHAVSRQKKIMNRYQF